jgi:hypothetical protein
MQRKTGQIRMRVALGDHGGNHEATCMVTRNQLANAESTSADGSELYKATSVTLTIDDPEAQKDFPIHIVLDAESATRLTADILDWLAPRSLLPRYAEASETD